MYFTIYTIFETLQFYKVP